jgi:NADH-quinone oxidoreductase subunit I
MPISEKDVDWIEEPELSFWEQTFLPGVASGLKTAIKHVVAQKSVTQEYPEVKPDLPLNYRGVHRLNRDEQGRVRCVACFMCATACPAHCISIVAEDASADWPDRDKRPQSFVLDQLRCIYCGMCEEACPCDAIELTSIYDLTGMSREQMMFDKEKLLSIYDQTKDHPKDPVRTRAGRLGCASEIEVMPFSATTPKPPEGPRAKTP